MNVGPDDRDAFGALAASAAARSKSVIMFLLNHCLLLFSLCWSFVFGPCFVVRCLMSFLVLRSSNWGPESWLLCFGCSCWCSVSPSRRGLVSNV